MVARIVFGIFLLASHQLVKLQAMLPSSHVPSGGFSLAQTMYGVNSWILNSKNSLPGSYTSGKWRSRNKRPGRVAIATKSFGNNQTWLNLFRDSKIDNSTSSRPSGEIPTKVGRITSIWELMNGTPVLTQIDDFEKFKSHSCYMIFLTVTESTAGELLTRVELHYWIGNQSTDENAANTAALSMLNKYSDQDFTVKLYREAEGQESSMFRSHFEKKPISFLIGSDNQRLSYVKSSGQVEVDGKRIFLIERKNIDNNDQKEVLELKEVELPLAKVVENKEGCFVFVLERVFLCCGIKASISKKLGGVELTKIMMKKKGLKDEEIVTYQTDRLFLEKTTQTENLFHFFEEFKHLSDRVVIKNFSNDSGEFTQKELRTILGETVSRVNGKEWFMIKVTQIFNSPDESEVQEEVILLDNLFPLMLEDYSQNCLLVDSKSNCGLFLWMGVDATVKLAAECARKAELYLRKEEYYYANSITFINQEDLPSKVDSAQKMVEFLVALNENGQDQSSVLSSAAKDSLPG